MAAGVLASSYRRSTCCTALCTRRRTAMPRRVSMSTSGTNIFTKSSDKYQRATRGPPIWTSASRSCRKVSTSREITEGG
eukprot:4276942-Amphidinium_carterae.1